MGEPFQSGENAFHAWRRRVHSGEPDAVFVAGVGDLARFPIAPRRVTLVGGAPGEGKTALTMQLAVDAVRMCPKVRLCVCNVEMCPAYLFDRQLARISGIDLGTIQKREFTDQHAERVDQAMTTLEEVVPRLCFVGAPFDLTAVANAADETGANLLVLDYIQRIRPPDKGRGRGDKRGDVDATMDFLRQFADQDTAVVVISAVGRGKDPKGRSSYDAASLNLASFRESSELEYGADDAFIISAGKEPDSAVLRHLKSRHGERADIPLHFHKSLMRFTPVNGGEPDPVLNAELSRYWGDKR